MQIKHDGRPRYARRSSRTSTRLTRWKEPAPTGISPLSHFNILHITAMQNLLLQKKIIYDSTLLNIDLSFLTLSYFMISFLNMQYQQQKREQISVSTWMHFPNQWLQNRPTSTLGTFWFPPFECVNQSILSHMLHSHLMLALSTYSLDAHYPSYTYDSLRASSSWEST